MKSETPDEQSLMGTRSDKVHQAGLLGKLRFQGNKMRQTKYSREVMRNLLWKYVGLHAMWRRRTFHVLSFRLPCPEDPSFHSGGCWERGYEKSFLRATLSQTKCKCFAIQFHWWDGRLAGVKQTADEKSFFGVENFPQDTWNPIYKNGIEWRLKMKTETFLTFKHFALTSVVS